MVHDDAAGNADLAQIDVLATLICSYIGAGSSAGSQKWRFQSFRLGPESPVLAVAADRTVYIAKMRSVYSDLKRLWWPCGSVPADEEAPADNTEV